VGQAHFKTVADITGSRLQLFYQPMDTQQLKKH